MCRLIYGTIHKSAGSRAQNSKALKGQTNGTALIIRAKVSNYLPEKWISDPCSGKVLRRAKVPCF